MLNTDQGYEGQNPIERQLRSRVFWLLYGGDRTTMCTDGTVPFLSEDDIQDVELPLAMSVVW